jgi:lipid-A-disaccharide synthase
MQVLFSAGEASGDLYAASLATELLRLDPTVRIGGIGGTRFAQIANEPLIADSSAWGAMSVIKSIRKGFSILPYFRAFKRVLRTTEPGVFVPIDFGFMNLKLCRAAKEAGWKVVYFVPPGSWRRDRQGADIPKLTDAVVTPFPWSYEILKQMGANVHFFGHPLKQIHKEIIETPFERKGLSVLPGSRQSELEQLVPTLRDTVKDYDGKIQLPVPKTFIPYLEKNWTRKQDDILNGAETGTVMRALRTSEAGIICSGTATLEAALAQTPTVVVYKVSDIVIMELWLIRFKRPQFASQPNILLQREVVPELLQENFTVEKLKRTLDEIQTDAVAQKQRAAFAEISELLGGDDCITKTAELILGN